LMLPETAAFFRPFAANVFWVDPFNRITRVKFFPLRIISVARRE
jgi:hypothetical protein